MGSGVASLAVGAMEIPTTGPTLKNGDELGERLSSLYETGGELLNASISVASSPSARELFTRFAQT